MAGLTQQEILTQLRTRGFEEGYQQTPLREFRGTLTDVSGEMRDGLRGSYLVVGYNFTNVEVIESTEPYVAPIAQIQVSHSSRSHSKMGYLGKSIDKIINAGLPDNADPAQVKGQDYLLGKTLQMKIMPGHMIWNNDAKEERPIDCWELVAIVGEGAPAPAVAPTAGVAPTGASPISATQQALKLLDGKTETQWHQVVFTDPMVKADVAIINAIIGRTFLPPMETAEVITKDADGIYHVK